jgi:HSP20 family protein
MSKALPFAGRWPQVDVIDRDAEVVIKAEVPGVDRKDLSVTVTDDTVTIRGEKKREEKVEKGDYYRCEIERGEFVRTVALPAGVDGAKARATFKDGVLELSLPKSEKVKRHNVTID